MTGLLTLSEPILCRKEVLGNTFECTIAGFRVLIHFPLYPIINDSDHKFGIQTPLLSPQTDAIWKKVEDRLRWGYPMSHPSGNSCVELLAISIECEKERIKAVAKEIYESISKWEHAFIDFLTLETKHNIGRDENIRRESCRLELEEDNNYIPIERAYFILNLYVPDPDSFASEEIIKSAIAFASSEKELLLEYQMLLSAYNARRNNQNRQAILDACAAVELALVNQIDAYCKSINLLPEILIDKYRYLGERFSLVQKTSKTFPKEDYRTLIVEPRNKVMHNRDVFPTNETTDKLIACVEVFLKHFHTAYY